MATIGELIADRYLVQAVIGRGGMSTVYKVLDSNLNVERALKELSALLAADADGRAQFLEEAQHAARLVHPNIVTIHDHFVWQDTPYIVMEYFPLGDVHALVARLHHDQVVGLLIAVLNGLSHAHGSGVLHRDIKPRNLMRTDDGTVKIGDFGIATSMSTQDGRTPVGLLRGSPTYVAPELLQGRRPTAASDLYSVGVVAYELLRGFAPFASDAPSADQIIDRKLSEESVPIQFVVPDLHIEIATWIDRLLLRSPARRYESATHALDALGSKAQRAFGSGSGKGSALPVSVPAPSPVPKIPVSAFGRYRELIRTASPWSLIRRAATRPLTVVVTFVVVAAAIWWSEGWLYAMAGLTLLASFALTFFDRREAYLARGVGRDRARR
jgi:serine/threonine protein kinase